MRRTRALGAFLLALGVLTASAPVQAQILANDPAPVPPHGDEGCWVMLFKGKNFKPPMARLEGEEFIERFATEPAATVTPELRDVGGQAFFKEIRSVVTGPTATMLGFEGERFSKQVLEIKPNLSVRDLDALQFRETVKSVKVRCGEAVR